MSLPVPDIEGDRSTASLGLSSLLRCSPAVVVAPDEPAALSTGSALALGLEAPLLVVEPGSPASLRAVADEIQRLGPETTHLVGDVGFEHALPGQRHAVDAGATHSLPAEPLAADAAVWLATDEITEVALRPTARLLGASVATNIEESATRAKRTAGKLGLVGEETPTQRWQRSVAFTADALPGGGTSLFPGRRFVAFYGSPVTFRLGVLGEQDPERTMDKLEALAAEYALAGEDPVIPALELIVTVADWKPGDDNDYSNEVALGTTLPWVEEATKRGGYVFLDLQPGRADFLSQAQRYEWLLKQPNVGLALDPEWRLEPDQEHLHQIGSVSAAEVNEVGAWLAELVRQHELPQKLLVLHQFNEDMIRDRHLIATPPELAVVIHVDGQGPLFSKYGTWDELRKLPTGPDQALWWGWKNFIDEDTPTATPEQVNAIYPLPVIVTYQ